MALSSCHLPLLTLSVFSLHASLFLWFASGARSDESDDSGDEDGDVPAGDNTQQPAVEAEGAVDAGPSQVDRDDEQADAATTAAPQDATGRWQVLLDGDKKELKRYKAADDHLSYLQGCKIGGKETGCYLVGALKETDTKPEPLGAALLVSNLVRRHSLACCFL